ncbi:hypothetical protein [Sphingobium aromaticivastans]|uniref:hypothetical protein n=1 Tax=Sphingobium aromaticivastans TaxID=1778665 RepID=UPI0030198B16
MNEPVAERREHFRSAELGQAQLEDLRKTIDASIALGGEHDAEDIRRYLLAVSADLV